MPIAFVISRPEEEIVHAVMKGSQEPFPAMVGGLFKFRNADLPSFINAVQAHAKGLETASEGYRAAIHLTERLGTWMGQQIVAAKSDQPDLFEAPAPNESPRKTRLWNRTDRTTS
jgi:hypothetical protein